MSKFTESAFVKCPFYNKEDKQKLYCEGVFNNSANITHFYKKGQKEDHKRKYCYLGYENCKLYKVIMEKYHQ